MFFEMWCAQPTGIVSWTSGVGHKAYSSVVAEQLLPPRGTFGMHLQFWEAEWRTKNWFPDLHLSRQSLAASSLDAGVTLVVNVDDDS